MIIYPEASYPITFRAEDAKRLGNHLKNHDSVVLIGMKRVGINNFLRFFLHHPEIQKTYINNGLPHVFIPVDLNDLVEREVFPFWTLVLKRCVDVIERLNLPEKEKQKARKLFSESIQLKDLFFTIDSVQKVLNIIVDGNYYPTLFLIRFDRLQQAFTQEFFHNLQGVKDATHRTMSYVFTSYRPLQELRPDVFQKSAMTVFSQDMYIRPANDDDMKIVLETFLTRYSLSIPEETKTDIRSLSCGHVQYLHIAVLKLSEMKEIPAKKAALITALTKTEELAFQSEELFESLTSKEQALLSDYRTNKVKPGTEWKYLLESGMVQKDGTLFSPFFEQYMEKIRTPKNGISPDFTKKEHLLFSYLEKHEGQLCERDDIIAAVWPEYEETGVSDWAIDRLIARVRAKLKEQASVYEIVTVITRGYKLMRKI